MEKGLTNLEYFEKLSFQSLLGAWVLLCIVLSGCSQHSNDKIHLVGHRGAAGLMPENTLPAVQKALEYNVTAIEFDVVITGDQKVVVSHEPWFRHDICLTPEGDTLTEKTQMERSLYAMSYEQIKRYDCGRLQHPDLTIPEDSIVSKPLMSDVIKTVESNANTNHEATIEYFVEVKSRPGWDDTLQPAPEKTARYIYDELKKLGVLNKVYLMAFDERMLKVFHSIDPGVSLVYLTGSSWDESSKEMKKFNFTPEIYAPNHSRVDSVMVRKAHEKGMEVVPWTVNDYAKMVGLLKEGVDGIISDYPNYFEKLKKEM